MLKIHTLTLGLYQTNCYIVHNETSDRCVVIDPGYDAPAILRFLEDHGLHLEAVLLTHGHFDHVGGVESLVRKTNCRLWMRESDYTQFKTPENDLLYPIHDCDFTEVHFCEEGEIIHAGDLTFSVMETPGHTWGSVCYFCEDAIFTGDTLFAGSCGRTDLPGGDWAAIQASLSRLAELDEDHRIFPGHGASSTLAQEKQYNPYLR